MHVQNCFANKTYCFLTFPLPSSSWFRQVQAATATKTAGLISNNFARAAHYFCSFLCRCLARRQRETPRNSLVTRFMEEMLYVVLFTFFSLPVCFTLVAASISHILTAAIKFSCCSSNEIGLLCFLSLVLALSLLSTPT